MSSLGVTIRRLRRERGLSQEALADLAHIDRSYMSGIERGHRNISVLNVARIAGALRVPIPELLYGHDAPADSFCDVAVAVDELSAALRILQQPAPSATAAKTEGNQAASASDASEVWKPGWYLSLS